MRVGISIAEQVQSSQFKFEGGNGEVVGCKVIVDYAEAFDETRCGYAVEIQSMTKDWQPTQDEPVTEFLSAGPVAKFHPGNAASNDDPDPEDLGDEVGTEGNCLISVEGKHPDKKAKLSRFGASLEEHGFPVTSLNGYAPNLIGLKAEFFQQPNPGSGTKTKSGDDPTYLSVTKIAQLPGGKTVKVPPATTGRPVAVPKPPAKAAAAAPGPKPAAAAASAAATAAAPEPAAETNDDEVRSIALDLLKQVGAASKGLTMTRPKIGSKLVTLLAKNQIGTKLHKPIQELIKDDKWFVPNVEDLGWGVLDNGEVMIPAA